MTELINLTNLHGISGREHAVRDYIISKITSHCTYKIDPLGNIIAFKKGDKTPEFKLMLDAHMDEVGFIVSYINDTGFIKFSSVGGIDSSVAIGARVLINGSVKGVIGQKPIHLLSDDEKKNKVTIDNMLIDIGASSKKEAEKLVQLGDSITFDSNFIEFGDGFLKAKALDDRAGCAILIDLITSEIEYDCYFTFTVQEELGLRGAKTAAYDVNPDYAIVVECTTANDVYGVNDNKAVSKLKNGPVISFMDTATLYDKELFKFANNIAKENKIPYQTKTFIAGGNNSGAIHLSRGGVKTVAVSIPCRYLHSPVCVIAKEDYENTAKLVNLIAGEILNGNVNK